MALDSVIFEWALSDNNPNLSVRLKFEQRSDHIEVKQSGNDHAYDYRFRIDNPWLDLIAAGKSAELTNLETGNYYRGHRCDPHDTIYFTQILEHKIFLAWKTNFLWLTNADGLRELDTNRRKLMDLVFRYSNGGRGDTESHYNYRHAMIMECLNYVGLL
jgi:hypothetical protein